MNHLIIICKKIQASRIFLGLQQEGNHVQNVCCQEIDVSQIVLGDIVQVHDGTLGSTEKFVKNRLVLQQYLLVFKVQTRYMIRILL